MQTCCVQNRVGSPGASGSGCRWEEPAGAWEGESLLPAGVEAGSEKTPQAQEARVGCDGQTPKPVLLFTPQSIRAPFACLVLSGCQQEWQILPRLPCPLHLAHLGLSGLKLGERSLRGRVNRPSVPAGGADLLLGR